MKPTGIRDGEPTCEHKDRAIYAKRLCASCYNRQYRQRNPQQYRNYQHKYYRANRSAISVKNKANQLRIRYGLTQAEVDGMARAQGHACAICREPFKSRHGFRDGPHIDHDHLTGATRGLLCGRCNHGLGEFRDHPALLRAAAAYLED